MSRAAPARLPERQPSGAADASTRRIGILAGGGRLPLMIAEGVLEGGGQVHIVGIDGEADPGIGRFPHTWVNWGQVGRMVATLRAEADALVIAGGVRRPDLWKLRPDVGFFLSLPQILEMLAGGDDSVLSRVVRFFEAKGIAVRGAHEVAPDLLALAGPAGALSLDRQARADAELGFAVRAALGPLDAGQAVVIADGRVLAIEGAEGTDAMLARVAGLRGAYTGATRSGVLAKGPKPGQELRVDMPAIGPRTVEAVAGAGLAGVAIEAGAVLLLDRLDAIEVANARGIAIEGLSKAPISHPDAPPVVASPTSKRAAEVERGADRSVASPLAGEGQGGGDSRTLRLGVPPTPNPFPHSSGAPTARRGRESGCGRTERWRTDRPHPLRTLRVIGRPRPNRRASADIEKGLVAIECLSRFDTGQAVVVARAYILAIAAAETTLAVLERTRALRQWGVGAKRRIGVLACRVGASEWDAVSVEALLDRAAAAGLAGVAVTGAPEALAAFEGAGGLADRHGLFLAMRGERP
jgi:DUF1009 family protein